MTVAPIRAESVHRAPCGCWRTVDTYGAVFHVRADCPHHGHWPHAPLLVGVVSDPPERIAS